MRMVDEEFLINKINPIYKLISFAFFLLILTFLLFFEKLLVLLFILDQVLFLQETLFLQNAPTVFDLPKN